MATAEVVTGGEVGSGGDFQGTLHRTQPEPEWMKTWAKGSQGTPLWEYLAVITGAEVCQAGRSWRHSFPRGSGKTT